MLLQPTETEYTPVKWSVLAFETWVHFLCWIVIVDVDSLIMTSFQLIYIIQILVSNKLKWKGENMNLISRFRKTSLLKNISVSLHSGTLHWLNHETSSKGGIYEKDKKRGKRSWCKYLSDVSMSILSYYLLIRIPCLFLVFLTFQGR